MVENRSQLDESLIASFITPYSSHLSLLAAPKQADSADEIEPQHVFTVLQRLREVYEYVVIDPQHTFDSITLAALDQSDEIVLVLTLDIPAIRSTQRALEIFDRLGYPRKRFASWSIDGANRLTWICERSRGFSANRSLGSFRATIKWRLRQ
jgi:pilus assembly protein CpaE